MRAPSRSGRVHPLALGAAAAALLVAGWWFTRGSGDSPPDLPDVDLANAAAGVEARFDAAVEALEANPRDGKSWGRVGAVLDVNGLQNEAIPFYSEAVKRDSGNFIWPYCLGVCLRTSDIAAAAEAFAVAMRHRGDYLPLLVSAGLAFERSDRTKEAKVAFEAALNIDPRCAPAHEGLAALALREDDLATAERHLLQATRAAANYAPAWRMLAQVHDRRDQADKAARARTRASKGNDALPVSDPERSAMARSEGVLPAHRDLRQRDYLASGRLHDAITDWQEQLRLTPDSALAHKRLCGLLVRAGKNAEADRHLASAVRLEPASAAPHIAHGVALQAMKRDEAAEAAFRAGLAADDASIEARVHLGTLLCRVGRLPDGTRVLEQALQAEPENSDALYNLGVAQLQSGAHELAARSLERLAKIKPDHAGVHSQWGLALMTSGKEKEAMTVLQQGLRELPLNTDIVNRLAWLLATANDDEVRNGAFALNAARKLNDPARGEPTAIFIDTLAAAYAATGAYDGAAKTATQAEQMARRSGNTALADRIKVRIATYKANEAWRGLQ